LVENVAKGLSRRRSGGRNQIGAEERDAGGAPVKWRGKRSKAAAFKQKDAAAGSCEAVGTGAEETEVSKNLELLADFRTDVTAIDSSRGRA
jgi:hypothetical protein